MTKTELRREIRRRLGEIASHRAERSRAIVDTIASQSGWEKVRTLALYSALPGEPDLTGFWEMGERRFCYPRIDANTMVFCEVRSLAELHAAKWHPKILEPAVEPARIVAPQEINVILVPGLAFTRDGHRLGRGGGFYDRYLADVPSSAVRLGVCFECQIVDAIPLEEHDQKVGAIVTESGIIGALEPFIVAS